MWDKFVENWDKSVENIRDMMDICGNFETSLEEIWEKFKKIISPTGDMGVLEKWGVPWLLGLCWGDKPVDPELLPVLWVLSEIQWLYLIYFLHKSRKRYLNILPKSPNNSPVKFGVLTLRWIVEGFIGNGFGALFPKKLFEVVVELHNGA